MNVNGYEIKRFADLRNADLAGANLVGADLGRANLRNAVLAGADLTDNRPELIAEVLRDLCTE